MKEKYTKKQVYLLLNSGPAPASRAWVALVSLGGGWVVGWSVTLCSSFLGQATDKFYTVLERGKIGHEDPTIKWSNI